MKLSLVMLLICLALMACRTSKKFQSETTAVRKTDSSVYQEKVKLDTLKAARETVSAAIPFTLLRDSLLPYYEKRNGRATVSIERVRDSIIITATCDSLEKIIVTLEKEKYALQMLNEFQQKNKEQVTIQLPLWFRLGIIGACVAGVALLILQFVKHFKR